MSADTSTRRTKLEMQRLDERIVPLYERGLGCRAIGAELGEAPAIIYKRLRALGLARSKEEARQVALAHPVPFSAEVDDAHLAQAAIGEAVSWFLRHGYVPSLPVAVAQYDLIAESDDGLVRVQVKSTTHRVRSRWNVGINRFVYEADSARSANGARKRRPYRPDEVDLFFIVTGSGDHYLIPLAATGDAVNLTLDDKYASYKV